jgi:hypothetical protein
MHYKTDFDTEFPHRIFWLWNLKRDLSVENVDSVCSILMWKGQAAVKNTSRQNVGRSIRKRNQSANFCEHKKDRVAPWIYLLVRPFSLFFAIFALRDTNQILMLSLRMERRRSRVSIKLLYLNMR